MRRFDWHEVRAEAVEHLRESFLGARTFVTDGKP